MGAFYHENIEVLRKRLPIPAAELGRAEVAVSRRSRTNTRGVVVYECLVDGAWRTLTSAYDPVSEAGLQVENFDVEQSKLIFILGEAGLYHLEEILRRCRSDARVMLMSGAPGVLRHVLETRDFRDVLADERLVFVISEDLEIMRGAVRGAVLSDIYDLPTFEVIVHPVEQALQKQFVDDVLGILHWTFTISLVNIATTQHFEHWWSHNFLVNIPFLLSGTKLADLSDSWAKRPVVIVGAGPSLTKNVEQLRRIKGHALIFCVDTAYRILESHGIEPDLIVTLDGSPNNALHLKDRLYSHIPVLMDEYSHRDITRVHSGPKVVLSTGMFHLHWWNKIIGMDWNGWPLSTGGSVATAAFSFARWIDADPVIMIGVDLSYPDGACYAAGALNDTRTISDLQGIRSLHEVPDINGNLVFTTQDYLFYLRWLHVQAKSGDRTYVNATEGGALREGFRIMTLRESVEEYCRQPVPTDSWKRQIQTHRIAAELRGRVVQNLKYSRRELRAAGRLFALLMQEYESYWLKLQQNQLDGIGVHARQTAKARRILERLTYALAFLDSHSFQAVYTDLKVTENLEREKDQHSRLENAMLSTRQAYNLVNELRGLADQSIRMHDDGIAFFEMYTERWEESAHESVLRV